MSEQDLPQEWKALMYEQRNAKIRQANAIKEQLKAIEQEIETMRQMANLDKCGEKR